MKYLFVLMDGYVSNDKGHNDLQRTYDLVTRNNTGMKLPESHS